MKLMQVAAALFLLVVPVCDLRLANSNTVSARAWTELPDEASVARFCPNVHKKRMGELSWTNMDPVNCQAVSKGKDYSYYPGCFWLNLYAKERQLQSTNQNF